MGPIGVRRIRTPLAIAALLPLLAGCWWLEAELEPGEWRHRSGTIGDFQPHHTANLYEADGYGRLQLECGQGPISFSVAPDREIVPGDDAVTLPVRYRLDGGAPAAVMAYGGGTYLQFRDPQLASGEDPMVAAIGRARRLLIRIDWSPTDRQLMRFDTSRAEPAIARLRAACTASRARRGG